MAFCCSKVDRFYYAKPRKESNLISQEIHTELRRLIEVQGNSELNTAKILNISRVTVKNNLKKIDLNMKERHHTKSQYQINM